MSKKPLLILIVIGVLAGSFNSFLQLNSAQAATEPIYSLFVSGEVTIEKEKGYARIILVDQNNKEYLAYEIAGPVDSGTVSFKRKCEETCVLDGIVPKKVKVEVEGATIKIDKISYIEDKDVLSSEVLSLGINKYRAKLDQSQEKEKIKRINQYIKENGLEWTAGETSISNLSYHQRRKTSIQDLPPGQKAQPGPLPEGIPSYFDWRGKDGLNYTTRAKNQEEPYSCGSCWIFATLAAIESQIEIDYDIPKQNPDLSEQDAVSCSEVGGCGGGGRNDTTELLTYIKQEGITTEQCFPYTGIDSGGCSSESCGLEPTLCEEKCDQWWNGGWKISSYSKLSSIDEPDIKQALVSGPLITLIKFCPDFIEYKGGIYETSYGICTFGHAVLLVGYGEKEGKTYWIGKNSWGENWGENGFFRVYSGSFEISDLYQVNSPQPLEPSEKLKVDCTAVPRKVKV